MDTPRRWQVASVVTAAASIGAGALALHRPSAEAIEPIDLDVLAAQVAPGPDADPPVTGSLDAVIVPPDLLERVPTPPTPATPVTAETPATPGETPATPATPATLATPATPASIASPDDDSATTSTAPATTSRTAPAPADSPDSVHSPDSIDT
ncbi:hypothetical protein [Egicoccus sp. AB-alg2]|uniref:hypothetical protein n=1 Tax=Egicoccus sp. AB-alg2 TaxID=3242693 RepID=UPI00359E1691